jgi:hypothetical protein
MIQMSSMLFASKQLNIEIFWVSPNNFVEIAGHWKLKEFTTSSASPSPLSPIPYPLSPSA